MPRDATTTARRATIIATEAVLDQPPSPSIIPYCRIVELTSTIAQPHEPLVPHLSGLAIRAMAAISIVMEME